MIFTVLIDFTNGLTICKEVSKSTVKVNFDLQESKESMYQLFYCDYDKVIVSQTFSNKENAINHALRIYVDENGSMPAKKDEKNIEIPEIPDIIEKMESLDIPSFDRTDNSHEYVIIINTKKDHEKI